MKGASTVNEIILFIGMAAITLSAIVAIPGWINDAARLFALTSAEIVTRDLAGLISISGAAPDKIIITYAIEKEGVSYNVDLQDRVITVVRLSEGSKPSDPAKTTYVIGFVNKIVEDAKTFVVEKKDGKYDFEVIE